MDYQSKVALYHFFCCFVFLLILFLIYKFLKILWNSQTDWQKEYSDSVDKVLNEFLVVYDSFFRDKQGKIIEIDELKVKFDYGQESDRCLGKLPSGPMAIDKYAGRSDRLRNNYLNVRILRTISRLKVVSVSFGDELLDVADVKFKIGFQDDEMVCLGEKDFDEKQVSKKMAMKIRIGTCKVKQ